MPLRDRTYINSIAELMGYLDVKDRQTLEEHYLSRGLKQYVVGKKVRFKKSEVDRWIDEHNEYQEVEVKMRRKGNDKA